MIFILIAINVLIFIIPHIINFNGPYSSSFQNFMILGWKENTAIAEGEYYRLFTSTFLHADGVHLGVNMLSLYMIGPAILGSFSALGFSFVFFLSGLGGSLMSYFFNPNPSVGASGAIFGLVGALLVYSLKFGYTNLTQQIFIIILLNVAIAHFSNGKIDNWGHFGGFLTGGLVGWIWLWLK